MTWWTLNGGMAVLLAMALSGNAGAQNAVLVTVWVLLLPTIAGASCPDVAAVIRAKGRAVPALMTYAYDIVFFIGLAWMGWMFTAAAWLVMCVAAESVYVDGPKS